MICPKCGKGRMLLHRVEHRWGEVAYIYRCEKCGYQLEVTYKTKIDYSYWPKPKPKPYMIATKLMRGSHDSRS